MALAACFRRLSGELGGHALHPWGNHSRQDLNISMHAGSGDAWHTHGSVQSTHGSGFCSDSLLVEVAKNNEIWTSG